MHDDGKPTVLFLRTHNAGRSQMALGFFEDLAGDTGAWSGGSEPGTEINPARSPRAGRGIDIAGGFPKPWTDETVHAAEVVITMGCGDACPIFPGKRYEDGPTDDPAGQDLDTVRGTLDDVERRVRHLLIELAGAGRRCDQRDPARLKWPVVARSRAASSRLDVSHTCTDPSQKLHR